MERWSVICPKHAFAMPCWIAAQYVARVLHFSASLFCIKLNSNYSLLHIEGFDQALFLEKIIHPKKAIPVAGVHYCITVLSVTAVTVHLNHLKT